MFRTTAHLYDLIYEASGKDYARESDAIRTVISNRHPGARSLLDVGCGTGAHLAHLRRWYEVEGLDADPGMLAEAARRLPGVALHHAAMPSFDLGRRFDAVICLFSSIGYLASAEELNGAVATMAGHLNDRGVLVIDGWVRPDQWHDPGTTHIDTAHGEGVTVVRASRSYRTGTRTSLEMHHLVVRPDSIEHLVDHHELTLFTPDEYEGALEEAALAFEVSPSPMAGRDRYVAWPSG